MSKWIDVEDKPPDAGRLVWVLYDETDSHDLTQAIAYKHDNGDWYEWEGEYLPRMRCWATIDSPDKASWHPKPFLERVTDAWHVYHPRCGSLSHQDGMEIIAWELLCALTRKHISVELTPGATWTARLMKMDNEYVVQGKAILAESAAWALIRAAAEWKKVTDG